MQIDSININSNGAISLAAIKADLDSITVNPKGSVSDWDTDVTNIRAAITGAENIRLGAGNFYLNTTDSEIFNLTTAKKIIGSGMGQTYFILKDGISTSTDVFKITSSTEVRDLEISGITFQAQTTGSARCRHIVNIVPNAGGRLVFSRFRNMVFPAAGDINGSDIYHYNSVGGYRFGNSQIDHNYFLNGISLTGAADDINVGPLNHFGGNNIGCKLVSMIAGAAQFYFFQNSAQVSNIVFWGNGLGVRVFRNNLEKVVGGAGEIVVYLNGGPYDGGLYDYRACVIENNITAPAGSLAHGLMVVGEKNTAIERNYLGGDTGNGYADLYIDTSCANIRVSRNNQFSANSVWDGGVKMKVYGLAAGETGLFA